MGICAYYKNHELSHQVRMMADPQHHPTAADESRERYSQLSRGRNGTKGGSRSLKHLAVTTIATRDEFDNGWVLDYHPHRLSLIEPLCKLNTHEDNLIAKYKH